ncbi:glycoside hydrolase family 3 C-terminal domain-containing protein [Ruminococcaceae bacterium OttesenSCG-928-L11]|nr:glycoside hydrolase family 3 C-terminal domain-containing protein [Ruminococcaceae bacterium OttesenSCG-928-L11]
MNVTKEARLVNTERAKAIVGQLTLEEKVFLMSGSVTWEELVNSMAIGQHYNYVPYAAGGNERLGVPSMRFCDGPRGVVCGDKGTCFPVPMCRGASFDTQLEEEIGHAIGREIRGHGGNLFGGVCINLPYNPGWGRSQEVYGEESFALGQMGSALVRGVQDEGVIACIKHYAFNSMELSRFNVSVDCDRRTEREVYLPHFKDCIDAGAASVMSAYNLYKGTHCGHSDYLLRKVLKEEWGFDGFVISDFVWGVLDTEEAANGGMDIEMCHTKFFGDKLVEAVKAGDVSETRIDEAAMRIIRTLFAFEDAYRDSGKAYDTSHIGCKDHIALALKAAQEGITLLKNQNSLLPLDKGGIKKIAVLGKLGDRENIGDHGSSRVYPEYVVTPLQGISAMLPNSEVIYYNGEDLEHAKSIAGEADAVVFVVGYDCNDEGEYVATNEEHNYMANAGGDRKSLGLHADETALIQAVGPVNSNSTVVLIGGNTILMTEWMDCVSAILMAYYPGQEGGTAIAQILFGDINPSGKLPYVLPYKESDLPQVEWETDHQFYEYYHGYAKLEKEGVAPLLPYGFGLSYTTFAYDKASFATDGDTVTATVQLTNTGTREGTEVVQMYVGFQNSQLDRPVKLLRGFRRITLAPGETQTVSISCPVEKLKYFNVHTGDFELEHMEYPVYIGASASNADLLTGTVSL